MNADSTLPPHAERRLCRWCDADITQATAHNDKALCGACYDRLREQRARDEEEDELEAYRQRRAQTPTDGAPPCCADRVYAGER